MVTKKKTTPSFVNCDDIMNEENEAIQFKSSDDPEIKKLIEKAEKEEEIKNAIEQLKKLKDPKIKQAVKQAEEKLNPKVMKEKDVPIITNNIEKKLREQIDEYPFDDTQVKRKPSKPKVIKKSVEKKIPITNNKKDVSRKKVVITSQNEFAPVAHIKNVSYDLNWVMIRRKIIAFNKGLKDYWREMDKVVLKSMSKFRRVRDDTN